MELIKHSIPPGVNFLPCVADHVVAFAQAQGLPNAELSSLELVLPNLKLANDCAQALRVRCSGAVLLPHMATLSGMVEPWMSRLDVVSDSQRQLILHTQLRERNWFDEGLLWEVVGELTNLFDTLTEHAVNFPQDEKELLSQLENAFGINDSVPLAFEAKLVNTLWLAEAQGRPSKVSARLLACRQWMNSLNQPLVVIAEEQNAGFLQLPLEALGCRLPVLLLCPDRRLAKGDYAELLEAAWPVSSISVEEQSLYERAVDLNPPILNSIGNRLRMVSADSLESLAQAVTDQVLDWAGEGRQNIALIALDRLAARRARALLERDGVLLQDETGWKMSTTRVAAVVDSWLEVLASDAYHRSLIDLLRAPLLFADLSDRQKAQNALDVERLIQESGVASGLEHLLREAKELPVASILQRLQEAREAMCLGRPASICEWLRRLQDSLGILGALSLIERDSAGRDWLEWLNTRQAELVEEFSPFSFASWRHWFNRQMDSSLYRDESIDSPVVLTHLAATRLRTFEGVVLVGADSEHLVPTAQQFWLAHDGVRHALGLPLLKEAVLQQREDLASLMLNSDSVLVAWQSRNAGEEILPAPEIASLSAVLGMHSQISVEQHLAWQIKPDSDAVPLTATQVVPVNRVPVRLSASAMQTLLACPFHYFTRYVLHLGEQDALSEEMEKSDFGELLHGILKDFHARVKTVEGMEFDRCLQTLGEITDKAFARMVDRNFRDHAWRLRWRSHMDAYLAWQYAREKEGWHWQEGEIKHTRDLPLEGGRHMLQLVGRIDRIDTRKQGGERCFSLLDYKSRSMAALRSQVRDPDDVQLAFYALLHDMDVEQAGYVALDDDSPGMAQIVEPRQRAASLLACITTCFENMYCGQALPAQGSATACAYCEMRGVCRKEWLA